MATGIRDDALAESPVWSDLNVVVDSQAAVVVVSRLGDADSSAWVAIAPTLRPLSEDSPGLGLRVMLERQPRPDEHAIGHLVKGGQLRLDVTTAVTAAERAAAATALDERVNSLLVEGGHLDLLDGETLIATVATSTSGAGHMDVALDVDQTIAALDALVIGHDRLTARAVLGYRAAAHTRVVGIDGKWVDLFDAIANGGIEVGLARLDQVVNQLLNDGRLLLTGTDDRATALALVLAQRSMILDQIDDDRWMLRNRPWPSQRLSYTERRTFGERLELTIARRLADIASPHSPDTTIDLVAANDSLTRPVPDRLHRQRRRSVGAATAGWMNTKTGKQSVATVLKLPVRATPAILAADTPSLATGNHLAFVSLVSAPVARGPIVESVSAPAFGDHHDPNTMWWPPAYRLVAGATTANVDDDAFRVAVTRVGVDRAGQPVLAATITMTLEPYMTAASAQAVATSKPTRRLPVKELVATLEIPFIDTQDPTTIKHHQLVGAVRMEGEGAIVSFEVSHDWVRLTYTVLADPSFQSEPAALRVGYTFDGFHTPRDLDLTTFSSKLVFTSGLRPIRLHEPKLFAIGREEVAVSVDRVEHQRNVRSGKKLTLMPPALATATLASPITNPPAKLVQATFTRRDRIAIDTRCAVVPNRFVDHTEGQTTTIGCRSSLELGEIAYRMLTERPDLSEEGVTVYQSTSQPHRFVVLTAYAVGRREPEGGVDDHRPLFVVYAALDPDPFLIRVAFEAVLHPLLRPDQERRLRGRIRQEHPNAVLVWPTDLLGATTSFDWLTLDAITDEYRTIALPDGRIVVSADVDLPGWAIVDAALRHTPPEGVATVVLNDGTRLPVPLHLDPYHATGPRQTGPITIALDGDQLTLTNRTSAALEVTAVVGFDADDLVVADEPAALSLPPGSSAMVDRPGGTSAEVAFSATRSTSADLTEIRAFVEETQTQLLFGLLASLVDRGLSAVRVEAALDALDESKSVTLTDADNSVEMSFTLPLTHALGDRTVRFRLHPIAGGAAAAPTHWFDHDLTTSALIHLTDEHLD